ncbi:multiplied multi-transmembrane transporter-like protein [Babesia gibsoni]|uniref:Multiplied multi-transmembrane transporter-like protein n=1 Tax=Babesia gibsoni TaxID=33632 RepID=A0AAD8PDF7_BABGI|nr:multiplied multi-transmembrane transporter-like protein [Babesia gibsoni]
MSEKKNTVKYKWYAIVLYHVVTFLEGFNLQCTPVCMRAFEMSLGLTASRLSVVFATELLSLLGIAAVWGVLIDMPGDKTKGRKVNHVCSLGMLICGIACILMGCTSGFPLGKDQTSTWFSVANGAHCAGKVLSLMLVSVIATRNVVGQYGWRLYYCVVGYMWLAAAVPTYYGMQPKDKPSGSGGDSQGQSGSGGKKDEFWNGIGDLFTKRSYYFMISLIYVSESCELFMGYIVIYLQYCGVRNQMAGFAISVVHMGNMIAGFIGGYAIQKIHCADKNHGKLLTGIRIIAIRLFAITVLLRKPFQGGDMRWYHYMCLALFGFAQLNRTSIDRTMLSDFVKEKNSAIALSLCRVIAGIPSNFTFPPLIGYLAERAFGYITTDELVEDMDAFTKVTNATALSKSLLYIMGGSCIANMALYGGMMLTYSDDVNKLNEAGKCKEKGTGGGGAGTPSGGSGGSPSGPTSPEGGGSIGTGSPTSSSTSVQPLAATASPSAPAVPTSTQPTVTATATSVICEGISISSTKTTDAKSSEVSYVSCAASSQKASCMAVTGTIESSTSGANDITTNAVATCVGAVSTTESGTAASTICGGIAVYGSNDSKSDDATTAIVACATADVESSSTSKDGGKSRLIIQDCVGVAMRKTKEKGFFLAVGISRNCSFTRNKSSKFKN